MSDYHRHDTTKRLLGAALGCSPRPLAGLSTGASGFCVRSQAKEDIMSMDVNWYRKMKELKAELESVSDAMQDTKHLIYEWVKEYLDERSDQP